VPASTLCPSPSRQSPPRNGTPCPLHPSTPPRCSFAVDLAYMVVVGLGSPTRALSPRTPYLALLLHPVSPPVRGRWRRGDTSSRIGLSLEDASLDHLGGVLVVQLARRSGEVITALLHSWRAMSDCARVTCRTSRMTFGSLYPRSLPSPASQEEKDVVWGGGPSFELVVDPCFVDSIEVRRSDSRCRSEIEGEDRTDGAGEGGRRRILLASLTLAPIFPLGDRRRPLLFPPPSPCASLLLSHSRSP
jgi:hypothetical protein